jgi:hypothetical protein
MELLMQTAWTRASGWRGALRWLILLGALASIESASAAMCNIPAALLCEGCAEHVSIRVNLNGVCRISFTPGDGSTSDGSGKSVRMEIEIDRPKARVLGSIKTRRQQSVVNQLLRKDVSASCFQFNGRRFCE